MPRSDAGLPSLARKFKACVDFRAEPSILDLAFDLAFDELVWQLMEHLIRHLIYLMGQSGI